MPELVGQTIAARYRVEEVLGKGGMAEVYKVWDPKRSVFLAMKVLQADLAEDKIFLRRFRREAQTLAKLQHPNIVRLYGLERHGDLVYMLMDYVEGTTLRKELFRSKKPLSLARTLEIMQPVCAALNYAHDSGYVHCDVKPANIMINSLGQVLVSDFGISRMSEASTATLVGAGTPAYMAPEQVQGNDPTRQTDIYALGVVLYEMLTGGERPFTGEHAETTGSTREKIRWEQVRQRPPSPRSHNPSVPVEVETVILRCLEKDPAARYASMLDLLSALRSAITGTASGATDKVPSVSRERSTPKVTTDRRPPRGAGTGGPAVDAAPTVGEPDSAKASAVAEVEEDLARRPRPEAQQGIPEVSPKPRPAVANLPRRKRATWVWWLVGVLLLAAITWVIVPGSPNLAALGPIASMTPRPTSTLTPRPLPTATPKPAKMGETVTDGALEVTVLDVFPHDRIYTGDGSYHYANPGYMLIDLFVRLKNNGAAPLKIHWDDIKLRAESGDTQSPAFAGAAYVAEGEKVDPFDIRTDIYIDGAPSLTIPNVAYLRLYFVLDDLPEQTVWFGIDATRQVELVITK